MNELKQLTIDGKPLLDFGVITDGSETFNGSEPDVTTISVPGRSGDLVLYNGRYKNLTTAYSCLMRADFRHRFDELRAFLLYKPGYRRIEDAREPEYYRRGRIVGGLSVSDVLWTSDAGIFTLAVSFKPQRYLKSGEIFQAIAGSGSIYNPTFFEAKPLIRVYGTGSVTIGDDQLTVASHGKEYVDIDCEMQNAFYGTESLNAYVDLGSDEYPRLEPGENLVGMASNISKIEIMPRWWTI